MTKLLLDVFSFNSTKNYLEIIQETLYDPTVDGNLYTHTRNPLLCMCLQYEILTKIVTKFLSLKNLCTVLKNHIMKMILLYLDQVDDENFLTALVTERDFVGRDSLRIAVELELLDLVRAPKFQAIIKRQYYSDFDQSGSLF
jgi:hypothetical protein